MKKAFAMLMALMLTCCLCACAPLREISLAGELEAAGTTAGEPVKTPEASPEESAVPPDTAGLAGAIEGDRYVNRALGFTATIPEGWVFASDEETETLYGQTKDFLKGTIELPENSPVYLLICSKYRLNSAGLNPNINITINKAILFKGMYEEMREQFQRMYEDMYAQMGADGVEVTGVPSVVIGGRDYMHFTIVSTFGDAAMHQLQYMTMSGDYLLTFTYTCFGVDENPVMDAFMEGIEYSS